MKQQNVFRLRKASAKWGLLPFAALFLTNGSVFGKTASCPCSPCKCSPCTCGAGGKGDKQHHHDHDHASGVGAGVSVDLSGVGQRSREADPFAAGGGSSNTLHTEERPKTKTKGHTGQTTDTFNQIQLTGETAKDVNEAPPESPGGGATALVSDTADQSTGPPPPQTEEKKKKYAFPTPGPITPPQTQEKEKKYAFPTPGPIAPPQTQEKGPVKWPQPIQDWLDKKTAADAANERLKQAREVYRMSIPRSEFFSKNHHLFEVEDREHEIDAKAHAPGATNEDWNNSEKTHKEADKFRADLDKDFQQTPEGREAFKPVTDAEKAAEKAGTEEKEAGKNIDQATKDAALGARPSR